MPDAIHYVITHEQDRWVGLELHEMHAWAWPDAPPGIEFISP